jgi:hypothetical protein
MHDFQSMPVVALGLPYSKWPVVYVKQRRLVMAKNKERAVSILMFLGGILGPIATWDIPESPSLH